MGGWGGPWSSLLRQLIIPEDAGPDDPRVVISSNDPIAQSLDQEAAILFYWADGRAFMLSVEQSGGPDVGQLHIWSIDETPGSLKQLVDITHDVVNGSAHIRIAQAAQDNNVEDVLYGGIVVDLSSTNPADQSTNDVRAFGQSLPRGLRARVVDPVNSAAIGTAETTVLTLPSTTYYADRAYESRMVGGIQSTAVNMSGNFRVRKTNPSGQDLGEFFRYSTIAAGTPYQAVGSGRVFTVGPTDVTATIVLTLAGSAVSVLHRATVDSPRMFEIVDVGARADFPDGPELI